MVVTGVDDTAAQSTTVNDDAVLQHLIVHAQGVQARRHGGDAVALFHPQFLGAAQDGAATGTGRGDKQGRELIDGQWHLLAGDLDTL